MMNMNGWQIILLVISISLTMLTCLAWREVWGLLGGFGRGVYCETSYLLREARRDRVNITFMTFWFWVLFIYSIAGTYND